MAGRDKVTRRKLENMDMKEIADASDVALAIVKAEGSLDLTEQDEHLSNQLANLSPNEFMQSIIGQQRLLVYKLMRQSLNTAQELKPRQTPAALKYASEALRDMQGDASQHVSKVKRGFTPEEMKDILESLPKNADIEVTDVD